MEISRKRRNSEEIQDSGFKKALISPTRISEVNEDVANVANALDSGVQPPRRDNNVDATHIQHDSQDSAPITSHGSTSDVSTASSTVTSRTSVEAVVMTTMADILAKAGGDSNTAAHSNNTENHEHEQQHQHQDSVNHDVLKLQQELQQQIPQHSTTDTRLTQEQIIESITSIPSMRMLIEESLNGSRDASSVLEQQSNNKTSHLATIDATNVLVNLGDPSILATLEPTLNHTGSPRTVVDKEDTSQGNFHDNGSSGHANGSSSRANNEQEIVDPNPVTSDNPLHTKWLMATALKEKGIAYKTGTFSSHEDELIRQTIKDYVTRNNMPEDAIQRWFQNGNGRGRFEKNDLKALWVEIAVRLQNRPLLNIYLHVRRMFHPQNNVGAWSKEDDQKLIMLYTKHKGQWTIIGTELGRMADSCRDRYRNHLKDQSTMVTGPWQPHEDERLLTIMQDLALQQGKANILDSSPMWTLISERMQGTRTRHQCRHRYSQTLQPRLERGEWTAPSSAAAAAAAAVAANAAEAANATSAAVKQQQQNQQPLSLALDSSAGQAQNKTDAAQDVLMLAAALQGVLPANSNDNLLWAQTVSSSMQGTDDLHAGVDGHLAGSVDHDEHDPFSAAGFAASLPLPSIVPKAPKGPIRRRSGLQQQLDVLKMIQDDGYTDHTDIKWADIAQRIRDRVEEANAIQLAKIIQTHDRLDSKKQQHLQDNDGAAAAAAAATAAMAAAVSAAQAEAVSSLQRIPAANQIARTFMSSRCKIEGYKEMTLQQVIIPMMKDVERRIQHRRGMPSSSPPVDGLGSINGNGESSSSSRPSNTMATSCASIQQQEINDAAQQAAIAALSAQFPFLQQHQQHHHQQNHHSGLIHGRSNSVTSQSTSQTGYSDEGESSGLENQNSPSNTTASSSTSSNHHVTVNQRRQSLHKLSVEQQAQHQQELEQQQHNHDLAEQMLQVAFSASDMDNFFLSLSTLSSSAIPTSVGSSSLEQKHATRRVLDVLKSNEVVPDYSERDDLDGEQCEP
ncbi:RNA polymerase I enhancer binding protein [Mortierella sp. AD011]|nr:RNA polymerase I enhancer binding protein [Mortierella sp. AD010]KAF9383179.1 RNA polymerase I enhancer binding protein [Mortierella sp. AD011]